MRLGGGLKDMMMVVGGGGWWVDGRPWKPAQRQRLLFQISAWGLNTYLYAPKDDHKHRAGWREPYTRAELGQSLSLR